MYTVLGSPFTRAMRVMWMLEELGQDYTLNPCKPHSADILAITPTGKVPALLDGDAGLTDSVAIVTYLADKHGACTFPAGTLDRARQDGFTQFAVDVLEGALWTAAKNSFIYPEDMRVPAIKALCRVEFDRGLAALEQMLGDGPYVMGETFTVPDLIIVHLMNWAQSGSKWDLPKDGKIADYIARVRARPALAAAVARGKAETAAA